MMTISIRTAPEERLAINQFIQSCWFSTQMIIWGEMADMTNAAGFIAVAGATSCGLITYRINDVVGEILSLGSLREKMAIPA